MGQSSGSDRRNPKLNSDIDFIILSSDKTKYRENLKWLEHFGTPNAVSKKEWGQLTSIRTIYASGLEVEFGIANLSWADVNPMDLGTRRVVSDSAKIVFDRRGLLKKLLEKID